MNALPVISMSFAGAISVTRVGAPEALTTSRPGLATGLTMSTRGIAITEYGQSKVCPFTCVQVASSSGSWMTPAPSVTRNVPGVVTEIDIVSLATVSSVILSAIELVTTVDAACAGAAPAKNAAAAIAIARIVMMRSYTAAGVASKRPRPARDRRVIGRPANVPSPRPRRRRPSGTAACPNA